MTSVRSIGLVCGGLYVAFFCWYTSFGGPLIPAEIEPYIEPYIEIYEQRQPDPETLALLRKFMEEDTGDDLVMVNVIDRYEAPLRIEGVKPGDTADAVLGKCMQFMYPALFFRACCWPCCWG